MAPIPQVFIPEDTTDREDDRLHPGARCGALDRSNLGFDYHDPDDFIRCQWQWPDKVYVVYRWMVLVYFMSFLLVNWVKAVEEALDVGQVAIHLRYLTEWAYDVLVISITLRAANVTAGLLKRGKLSPDVPLFVKMSWTLKSSWLLYNVASGTALTVSFSYWLLIHDASSRLSALTFHRHGMNSIYVIIDLFITATPVRMVHMYQPILFGSSWVIFSLVWAFLGRPPVYTIIDWNAQPGYATLYVLGLVLVGVPVAWVVLCILYKLRMVMYGAIYRGHFKVSRMGLRQSAVAISL